MSTIHSELATVVALAEPSPSAFQELLAWAFLEPGRHFTIKMGNTCVETRWRVVVWKKNEGWPIEGNPGEGYGQTVDEAARMALQNLQQQKELPRATGVHWYLPARVGELIGEKRDE